MLRVENVSKTFKNKQVLEGISFLIDKPEIVAILGRSGGGKTTLLRCINGLEVCEEGTIAIGDNYICKEDNGKMTYASEREKQELRKDISLVFQNYNLFPHMTVLENIIEAPVFAFGKNKDEAKEEAHLLLNAMGLLDKAEDYPNQLSGGQKQRVAIARACANHPQIICFDEPTSALDPELTETMGNIMKGLSKDDGKTIILVTHDTSFVKNVADRVVFLDEGKVIADMDKSSFFQSELNRVKMFVES